MEVSALKHAGVAARHGRSPLLRLQSDERLIALTRRGSHGAFETLVGRYQARLLAFCRHMLSSREDAEDVLQEVFAAAFNAIQADERPINVRPWLYRIARNRSLNHLRRAQPIGVDSMDVHFADHGISTADKAHKREDFRLLMSDVGRLPESQRTALLLRELDALPYEGIAEAMETTVPSVKSLLVRARVSLAEAAEARQLSCEDVRLELGEAAEGLVRLSAPARRHLKSCDRCSAFRTQLRNTNKALAAVLPVGPLLLAKKLFIAHLGTHSGAAAGGVGATGAGAGAAGSAAGTAALGTGAASAGTAGAGALAGVGATAAAGGAGGGLLGAGLGAVATKAVAGLAAAAVVTAGAVEVDRVVERPARTLSQSALSTPARPAVASHRAAPASHAARHTGTVRLAEVARPKPRGAPLVASVKPSAPVAPPAPAAPRPPATPTPPIAPSPVPPAAPAPPVRTQTDADTTTLPSAPAPTSPTPPSTIPPAAPAPAPTDPTGSPAPTAPPASGGNGSGPSPPAGANDPGSPLPGGSGAPPPAGSGAPVPGTPVLPRPPAP